MSAVWMQNLSLPTTKGEGGPAGLVSLPTETDAAHAQQGGWAGRLCYKGSNANYRGLEHNICISPGTE
jgi:hypothetical protein